MKESVQPAKAMYSFGYESRARALNGFGDMFNLPDFEERRARLVAGLDKESTAVVDLFLRRLKMILKLREGEIIDLFTREEQEAFVVAWRQLHSKIVQIAPDLFVWDGYALPCKHFEANVFLDGYGFRFLKTLGNIGNRAIIDAGAYIGDSALMLSPLTTGKVFAFEPMEENFKYLKKTILLNSLDNVVPVHCALGDNEGTVMMHVGSSGAGATIQNKLPGDILGSESVEVIRLDDFVRSHDIPVGLIKTDVEGAEQMLLRGAKDTICRDRPILLISIYHNASDFLDIKPMIESWNLGYRFQIYHPPIKSISGETVLIAECDKYWDDCRLCKDVCLKSRHIWRICAGAVALARESISQRNELLKKRDGQLAQREAQLGSARETIAKRDALLEKRNGQLAQREAQLGAAREVIAKRDELLKKRDGQLAQREAQLGAAREVIAKRDELLEKRNGQLAQREAQLGSARETIAQRDALLKKRDGQLAQREEQLGAAREVIAKRDELLKKRDGQLAQREAQLGSARETIAKRDALLEKRNGQLAQREAQLGSARETIAKRDALLEKRNGQLAQREAQLGSAQRVIDKLRVQKEACDALIKDSDSKINELIAVVDKIKDVVL